MSAVRQLDLHREKLHQTPTLLAEAWILPWNEIRDLPVIPGFELSADVVRVPVDMLPPAKSNLSKRQIDFGKALPEGWKRSDERSELVLRRLKRIALLDLTLTVKANRKMNPPRADTWVARTKHLVRAAKMALELETSQPKVTSTCPDGASIFGHLSPTAFQKLRTANPNFFQMNIPRLNGLYAAGYFDDWPAHDVAPHRREAAPIQPFCDEAFSEILKASFFLSKIQRDLEACYSDVSRINEDAEGRMGVDLVRRVRNEAIQTWCGETLQPGYSFPFGFKIPGKKRHNKVFSSWPVETLDSVKSLLLLCQCANAQVLLVATAARVSEIKVLPRDPIKRIGEDTLLEGYTFKETDATSGERRHWPLPDHAVAAITRQQSLLETLDETGPFLWWSKKSSKTDLTGMEMAITHFGSRVLTLKGVELEDLDGKLTSHRFRKSMSRLVGLALEGAPNVLFDVLGHTNMDVTLGYIMSDPDFQADAEKVRQEYQHVLRKRLVSEIDECGGPGAPAIRISLEELRARGIREDLGDDDPELLLAILPNIQQVGPYRYCTADNRQNGLCSKVPGQRDVGACNSACMFRLEAAAARQNNEEAIDSALDMMSSDIGMGPRVFFQAQIVSNLATFETTINKFSDDPRFRAALADCEEQLFAALPKPIRQKLLKALQRV